MTNCWTVLRDRGPFAFPTEVLGNITATERHAAWALAEKLYGRDVLVVAARAWSRDGSDTNASAEGLGDWSRIKPDESALRITAPVRIRLAREDE